jgi:hypothetical protein
VEETCEDADEKRDQPDTHSPSSPIQKKRHIY